MSRHKTHHAPLRGTKCAFASRPHHKPFMPGDAKLFVSCILEVTCGEENPNLVTHSRDRTSCKLCVGILSGSVMRKPANSSVKPRKKKPEDSTKKVPLLVQTDMFDK